MRFLGNLSSCDVQFVDILLLQVKKWSTGETRNQGYIFGRRMCLCKQGGSEKSRLGLLTIVWYDIDRYVEIIWQHQTSLASTQRECWEEHLH